MRYIIEDNYLVPVKFIEHGDGFITSNPSDEVVDSLGVGFPLNPAQPVIPEYNADTHRVKFGYELIDGQIYKTALVEPIPSSELIQRLEAEKIQQDTDYNTWRTVPQSVNATAGGEPVTLKVIPNWVYEYYTALMFAGGGDVQIVDAEMVLYTFSWNEFLSFYANCCNLARIRLADCNAEKARLQGEIDALQETGVDENANH